MNWPLEIVVVWALVMSLAALVHGGLATRRARLGPIPLRWRLVHGLFLFALGVGLTALPLLAQLSRQPRQRVLNDLRAIGVVALFPLFLWYIFALPLRLVRYYTQSLHADPTASHPLDGRWAARASFLDEIIDQRATHGGTDDPRLRHDNRPPGLTRVARLHETDTTPTTNLGTE